MTRTEEKKEGRIITETQGDDQKKEGRDEAIRKIKR